MSRALLTANHLLRKLPAAIPHPPHFFLGASGLFAQTPQEHSRSTQKPARALLRPGGFVIPLR